MMCGDNTEVEFYKFCKTCKFYKTAEDDDPCNECLTHGTNYHSTRPIKYMSIAPQSKKKRKD